MIRRRSLILAAPLLVVPRVARSWLVTAPKPLTSDPFYSNVVLLMHMDQANGSLAPIDQKGHVMTATSEMPITTAQFKFGTASLDHQNLDSGMVSTPDSADWDLGAGQFTIECWIRAVVTPTSFRALASQWGFNDLGWFFGFTDTSLIFLYSTTGTDSLIGALGAYTPTINGWDYVAVTRDINNLITIRANGVLIASSTASATIKNSGTPLAIGNDTGTNARGFIGQIDEFRITKGVARNISVVPTAPFFNS